MTTIFLYRHYDGGDALLYVGISVDPDKRLDQHKKVADWAHCVSRTTLEVYDDIETALAAEATAIRAEKPKHNLLHNRPSAREVDRMIRNEIRRDLGWLTIPELAKELDVSEKRAREIVREAGVGAACRKRPVVYSLGMIMERSYDR
jgi:predicted GIY-YIG superfamily endonuclease